MKLMSNYWYVVGAFVFGALVGAGVFNIYALPAQASAATEGGSAGALAGSGYVLSAGNNQAWILRTDGTVFVCEPGTSAPPAKGTAANAGGCRRVGSL
jgi:hypothetical protein